MKVIYERGSMCGTSGWWWQIVDGGRVRRYGWSAGKKRDAAQDVSQALAGMGAS